MHTATAATLFLPSSQSKKPDKQNGNLVLAGHWNCKGADLEQDSNYLQAEYIHLLSPCEFSVFTSVIVEMIQSLGCCTTILFASGRIPWPELRHLLFQMLCEVFCLTAVSTLDG